MSPYLHGGGWLEVHVDVERRICEDGRSVWVGVRACTQINTELFPGRTYRIAWLDLLHRICMSHRWVS